MPTLVMVGDLDMASSIACARYLAANVPAARLELFEGAAHMLNLEQPDRFTELVLGFLGNVDASLADPRRQP